MKFIIVTADDQISVKQTPIEIIGSRIYLMGINP